MSYSGRPKRSFDFVAGILLLIVAMPLLVTLWALVIVNLGSPAFFRQRRPGRRGEAFTIYKFRSMTSECAANGDPLPDEERLTKLGEFLRRTSVDELPELFNVLCGDMSLVGPRPLLMEYLDHYSAEQSRRHDVRPGITGWAQVNGRNSLTWDEKFRHDVWYVDHCGFLLDLRILSLTLVKVASRKDITADGYATMPKFGVTTKS